MIDAQKIKKELMDRYPDITYGMVNEITLIKVLDLELRINDIENKLDTLTELLTNIQESNNRIEWETVGNKKANRYEY